MKSLILFCSRWRVYLSEIPPIILLLVAIKFNDKQETLIKLYPLIILMSLAIIFIALYFTRILIISNEEIKVSGLFSSREKALIAKGKTVAVTLLPKHRIRVDVLEISNNSVYAWLKSEAPREIRLFSEKANGGDSTARKITELYGLDKEMSRNSVLNDGFTFDDENISVATVKTEDDELQIRIFFKKTI